jgi:crotonobetainyl-CoA:carnitine CoA-transferase CaiB-like acyl-CoA transferase
LEDLRILALEQFGAGPFGTMQLADLGADVIKVEDPRVGGDISRYVPPYQAEGSSLYFESFNRGKRSITLDVGSPMGRAVFERLVPEVDVVFSNLRGDQPAKLRLLYDDLKHLNRLVVCVSLSGFGTTGPRASEGAYDATVQGLAGWMSVTGGPEDPPLKSGLSLVDFSAGYVAALAIVAAVWRARREGVGGDADLSLFETALSLLTYMGTWTASQGWTARRMPDSAHQTVVPFQAFEAADGWLVVACPKEPMWRRLCVVLDRPELAEDSRFASLPDRDRNRDALLPVLREAFATRTVTSWIESLAQRGVPCAPVNDIKSALADPQTKARGALLAYDHPTLGTVRTVASPFRLAGGREAPDRGPFLGEHTAELLGKVGYRESELKRLEDDDAVASRPPERIPDD